MTVLSARDADYDALDELLARYGMRRRRVATGRRIPGSYWGDAEAGLIGSDLYLRDDTPIHSALHETCHYVCMDPDRRVRLVTDAGGDFDEENAACYLQILLADSLPRVGRKRMFADMDAWGYTFRLGSASAWFGHDADDARSWLLSRGLVDAAGDPTWKLQQDDDRRLQYAEGTTR